MWRSRIFWQIYLVAGGLTMASVLLAGLLIVAAVSSQGREVNANGGLQRQVWITVAVVGMVGLLLAFWLTRRIIHPLHELAQGAKQIAAGEYGRKVFAEGTNEVGILARSFNETSEQLAAHIAQIDQDRQQLRAVLGSMVEGVIALDAGQRILLANERASHLLEFDGREAVGRRLWEVVRRRSLHETVKAVLNGAETSHEELTWHGPKAKSVSVHASRLPGSPSSGAVLVLHDTTELRRLERLRQEFVANVSHELKTPLAVIKADVETLQDGAVEDVEHRGRFLQRIAEHSENLHRQILDLLSLARIEAGSETFVFQEVSLDHVIDTCLQQRRPLAEEKQHTLVLTAPDQPIFVWADEEAVLQILDNLVDNAIKYTPEAGRIEIRWHADGDWAIMAVADTGLGIPAAALSRVFERFFRVDKARSRQLGGTGLGLSIVKHLTGAMHGSVSAESRVNEGSSFTVRLPLVDARDVTLFDQVRADENP